MQGITAKQRTLLQASLMRQELKQVPFNLQLSGELDAKVPAEVGLVLYRSHNQPQLLVVEEVALEAVLEVDW